MFPARYSAARYESIRQYRAEPRRKVSPSKVCVETATYPLSTPTNLQSAIEQESVSSDVGAACSRNSQGKDMGHDST